MMAYYFDQFMWEDRFGKHDMFDNILKHIAEQIGFEYKPPKGSFQSHPIP